MPLTPAPALTPFVKSYSVITIETDLIDEVFYPSGYVDLAINLSGKAATSINGTHRNMPYTEVLGQLTVPTRLTVAKGTSVLLIRFYPHAPALFFKNSIGEFTNYATNLKDVLGDDSLEFYDRIVNADPDEISNVIDGFLLRRLRDREPMLQKVKIIQHVSDAIFQYSDGFEIHKFISPYSFTTRYIEKLFIDMVGISPRSLFKLQRFSRSVDMVLASQTSLTSIAYECGYFDQAHFIKDFKKFTGITPSEARPALAEGGLKFQEAVNIGI